MCNSKNDIESKIKELGDEQAWNHNIELPYGIQTAPAEQVSHGKNIIKWGRIERIIDSLCLSGKAVLDVGCNEGFFSLKLAEKGAIVTGIDVDDSRIKKAKFVNSVLQVDKVLFENIDIYSNQFKDIDSFDFCLCMGFLHRVPDPYRAIQAISQKTSTILFEWKALKHGPHDESYAYFSKKDIDDKDYYGTEYWLISYNALETILKRLGFKYFYKVDDPRQRRAILLAGKFDADIFRQDDVVHHRGRVRALLSHTKQYLIAIKNIISGKLNS